MANRLLTSTGASAGPWQASNKAILRRKTCPLEILQPKALRNLAVCGLDFDFQGVPHFENALGGDALVFKFSSEANEPRPGPGASVVVRAISLKLSWVNAVSKTVRMISRLRERPARRPVVGCPWSLQPVSRIVGERPLEFIRCKAWTAEPVRFSNGISAVTSLCLVDQPSAGGHPLLITGDEDGGVSVQRVPDVSEGGGRDTSQRSPTSDLRRAPIHFSGVNTIKVLPDERGFVCAGDDSVVSAVATLEVSSEEDIRRAATALSGHSGPVTDCDTAAYGHAILSSSTDGRMLLWDPVAANTPVASVAVGCPLNSACFSAGDPYALICAPELGMGCVGGGRARSGRSSTGGEMCNDLVQIWDLRSLRCYRDSIPAAMAAAFGVAEATSAPEPAPMQPPPPQFPSSIWADDSSSGPATIPTIRVARTPSQTPSWLTAALGSTTTASPATPLLRKPAWADDSSDNESVPSGRRWHRGGGSLWPCRTPGNGEKENGFGFPDSTSHSTSPASKNSASSRSTYLGSETASSRMSYGSTSTSPASGGSSAAPSPSPTQSSTTREKGAWVSGVPKLARGAKPVCDGPTATVSMASLPDSACLHQGGGKTWVPGGLMTWQPSKRRAHTGTARRACARPGAQDSVESGAASVPTLFPTCPACRNGRQRADNEKGASVYNLQVSSDGRGVLMASRDATVTLWDTQSREVVYRFGHSRLSMRARPILVEGALNGEGGAWGRTGAGGGGGGGRGDVFAGTTDGEVKAWRVGSRFPNRVYKPHRRHEGFEVTCLASSRDGSMFASADSSGTVYVQSATMGPGEVDGGEELDD